MRTTLERITTALAAAGALVAAWALAGALVASAEAADASTATGAGFSILSAPASLAWPEPAGASGQWSLVFDDEFNLDALGPAWSTGWGGSAGVTAPINPALEQACYDPANVSQGGGELDIAIAARSETCSGPGGTVAEPYAAGLISTAGRFAFTYGFIEARIWLPSTPSGQLADWPGFWTIGRHWPTDGELDVVEGLDGAACWHFHGPLGGPGGCERASFTGGWHTFGADWEPGGVTWYYDGRPVGAVASGVTSAPMDVMLELSVGRDAAQPIAAGTTMRVDYVRVWQH